MQRCEEAKRPRVLLAEVPKWKGRLGRSKFQGREAHRVYRQRGPKTNEGPLNGDKTEIHKVIVLR